MRHSAYPRGITRDDLLLWYRANRERSKSLFAMITDEAYYQRPIALRNPIVFYEGHFPAFSFNTLVKLALKQPGIDARLEDLFARGIDPEDEAHVKNPTDLWPSREDVQRFAAECDARVEDALMNAKLEDDAVPELRDSEAVFTILEHEQMHHETLLYMLHNLPFTMKRGAAGSQPAASRAIKQQVQIPRGIATLGQRRGTFGWDNEFPQHDVEVEAFRIDAHNVTNGDYLDYMNATGAHAPHFWSRDERGAWLWRGMFVASPLPLDAPVYVTHEEATAYARWKGMRLPTEAEWHRAAAMSDEPVDASQGNFDFAHNEPVAIGSYAPNEYDVYDLVGNGWEWTSTEFAGFDGFVPMPSYLVYSADFFDGAHYVMKGASPVTARELVRPSFRNWFRPNYPYVYATFRCVS